MGGVVLHAPFLSVYRIVLDSGCTLYGDKFPNVDFAPMINSPVLLVHGTSDQIVPFYHSERMLEALPEACRTEPLFVEGMGHNNVHSAVRPRFVEHVGKFLDDHVVPFAQHSRDDRDVVDETWEDEEEQIKTRSKTKPTPTKGRTKRRQVAAEKTTKSKGRRQQELREQQQ